MRNKKTIIFALAIVLAIDGIRGLLG